ncbi:MAG TPA: Nif3-like dinuclear metal center hexameric protein [Haloplasmataceae bacterium]
MNIREFNRINESLFRQDTLSFFNDGQQFGFNNFIDTDIQRVGYAINLTVDIVEQAHKKNIDLILTHHNIWDDLLELSTDTLARLKEYGIVHYFNHLPLDASDFGPTRMLAKQLGLTVVDEIVKWGDYAFGIVGEWDEPKPLAELEQLLDAALGHKSRVWQFNERLVKRVGVVAGSGGDPAELQEAVQKGCDAYITGEKKMKTILYAQHVKLNFLLGSHIFTERAGIEEYARRLQERMPELSFIPLKETPIE